MSDRLVIFDCDGVLVDSERLSARVMAAMAGELGLSFTEAEALIRIRGRKVASWVAELRELRGRSLPDDFVPEFRRRATEEFTASLSAVPGVEEVIPAMEIPYCVASSAPLEKIRHTLGLTGLLPFFEGRIHSAYEVGIWKPDPGLFLHAAETAHVRAANCVVVEDSVVGATAGTAAGMKVFGYAPPGSGMEGPLAAAGAVPFTAMTQLPSLIRCWAEGEVSQQVMAG